MAAPFDGIGQQLAERLRDRLPHVDRQRGVELHHELADPLADLERARCDDLDPFRGRGDHFDRKARRIGGGEDVAIVSDVALKQVIFNVLDNAYEVSRDWVELVAEREGDNLVLSISDRGPGFTPEMLAQLGKPYHSSKGRAGGGLGLFLVVNVVRKLGGTVTAENHRKRGATVRLTLPLATLAIGGNFDA